MLLRARAYDEVMLELIPSSQFTFAADLSAPSQTLVKQTAQRVVCPDATPLVVRGDRVNSVYLVLRGALRVYYVSAEGREGTLYWVEPGQSCILSLNCVFSRMAYPAWVESEGETEITIIPGATYRDLFAREPCIQGYTFETLSSRLFELMATVEESASQGLEARMAGFLVRRAHGGNLVNVTQDQIARHLATSREVVSRVLRRLNAQGLIETATSQIILRDPAALRSLL